MVNLPLSPGSGDPPCKGKPLQNTKGEFGWLTDFSASTTGQIRSKIRSRGLLSPETRSLCSTPILGLSPEGPSARPHRPEGDSHFLTQEKEKESLIQGETSVNKSLFQALLLPLRKKRRWLFPCYNSHLFTEHSVKQQKICPNLSFIFAALLRWEGGAGAQQVAFPLLPVPSHLLLFSFHFWELPEKLLASSYPNPSHPI